MSLVKISSEGSSCGCPVLVIFSFVFRDQLPGRHTVFSTLATMGLKLAAKKSYHPGKETNKARVARDEQLERESRDSQLESERLDRFSALRQKAGLVDISLEAKQNDKVGAVGSLQTFDKIVDPPKRANNRVNKMDPELAKAKMDPLADMNRFLEETEKWEALGGGEETRSRDERSRAEAGSDLTETVVRKHRSKRRRRSHRVSKDR